MGLKESTDYKTDNERIAALLGFKKHVGHKTNGNADGLVQWEYPKRFADFQRGVPCNEIPDFMGILNRYFDDAERYRYGMYERSRYAEYATKQPKEGKQ